MLSPQGAERQRGAALADLLLRTRLRGPEYGAATIALEIAGMHWMASVFLIALGLFAADLASGFGFFFRRWIGRIRTAGTACGLALVLVAHVQGLRPPVIASYDIRVEELPAALDGTTVALLSDLHVSEMLVGSKWLSARIDQVQALAPDAVVLVGDLFERSSDPAELTPVLGRLSAPLGVWAVRGNHDVVCPGRRDVTGEILDGAGIRLLANEWVSLADGLRAGRDRRSDRLAGSAGEGAANLTRALSGLPAAATLLLSHTPWLTDRAAAAGVDLILSGHTHKGQIWPFTYLVRTGYPFTGGRYAIDGMTLLVSRGTEPGGHACACEAPGKSCSSDCAPPKRE